MDSPLRKASALVMKRSLLRLVLLASISGFSFAAAGGELVRMSTASVEATFEAIGRTLTQGAKFVSSAATVPVAWTEALEPTRQTSQSSTITEDGAQAALQISPEVATKWLSPDRQQDTLKGPTD